jgi:hypothetical protein
MMMGSIDSDYFLSAWQFGLVNKNIRQIALAPEQWGVANKGDHNQ